MVQDSDKLSPGDIGLAKIKQIIDKRVDKRITEEMQTLYNHLHFYRDYLMNVTIHFPEEHGTNYGKHNIRDAIWNWNSQLFEFIKAQLVPKYAKEEAEALFNEIALLKSRINDLEQGKTDYNE